MNSSLNRDYRNGCYLDVQAFWINHSSRKPTTWTQLHLLYYPAAGLNFRYEQNFQLMLYMILKWRKNASVPTRKKEKTHYRNIIEHFLPQNGRSLDDLLMNGRSVQSTVRCEYDTTFITFMRVSLSPQSGFLSNINEQRWFVARCNIFRWTWIGYKNADSIIIYLKFCLS